MPTDVVKDFVNTLLIPSRPAQEVAFAVSNLASLGLTWHQLDVVHNKTHIILEHIDNVVNRRFSMDDGNLISLWMTAVAKLKLTFAQLPAELRDKLNTRIGVHLKQVAKKEKIYRLFQYLSGYARLQTSFSEDIPNDVAAMLESFVVEHANIRIPVHFAEVASEVCSKMRHKLSSWSEENYARMLEKIRQISTLKTR